MRSFIDYRCHHKHLPVSVTNILDELLKSKLFKLKQIQMGCYFERDEEHIQGILSRLIRKHRGEDYQFHIDSEDFKSTRCGSVKIFFFFKSRLNQFFFYFENISILFVYYFYRISLLDALFHRFVFPKFTESITFYTAFLLKTLCFLQILQKQTDGMTRQATRCDT